MPTALVEELHKIIDHGIVFTTKDCPQNGPILLINYQAWYTQAVKLVNTFAPERVDDFLRAYRRPKGANAVFQHYSIEDYLNLGGMIQGSDELKSAAFTIRIQTQLGILKGAVQNAENSIGNLRGVLQADLLDSEILKCRELLKFGYLRPAGVLAGVVLETYLADVCLRYSLKLAKKDPSINDYATALQAGNVIDTILWRKIQSLADIRNLCGHKKEREPTKEEVLELVSGIERIIKSLN